MTLGAPISAATVTDRTCALVLGVPWRTLRAWCRTHGVPVRRIGRRPVVVVADVLAALGSQERATALTEAEVIELAARRRAR